MVVTEHMLKGVKVTIEDTGIGIPSQELTHITEKFIKEIASFPEMV